MQKCAVLPHKCGKYVKGPENLRCNVGSRIVASPHGFHRFLHKNHFVITTIHPMSILILDLILTVARWDLGST